MKFLKNLTIVLCFVFFTKLNGQHISSIGVSNYARSQSMFLSPSLSGYSPYKWHVNLVGVWANVNNNYLSLRTPYSLYRLPNRVPEQYKTAEGNLIFEENWIQENLNGRNKNASAAVSVFGPSFSLDIGRLSVGMLSSAHVGARVVNLSENVAHAIYNEFDSAQGAFDLFNPLSSGRPNQVDPFTIAAHSHANVGLNLAYKIPLKWDRQIIPGVSIKRAFGSQGMALQTEQMELETDGQDSVFFNPTAVSLLYYGEGETARSWAYDVGLTYVFHKKEFKRSGPYTLNKTRYHSKITFAILDIGSFNYKDAYTATAQVSQRIGFHTDSFDLEIDENNYARVLDSFFNEYGTYTESTGNQRVGMPTRMVISSDFQLRKHFFISATWTQSLRSRRSIHMRQQSTLMLAPRWEHPYFEVSTPLLWAYDYRSLRLGLSARLGPLYLGTNSLLPFLYTRGFRDADVFVGIAFGNLRDFGVRKWLDERKEKRVAKQKAKDCVTF